MAVTKANLDFWPKGWMRNDLGMFLLGDRYIFGIVEREVHLGLGAWKPGFTSGVSIYSLSSVFIICKMSSFVLEN